MTIDVLIAGAGPTGSALAIDLVRRGVGVRVIDNAPRSFEGSRAKGLQPRTLGGPLAPSSSARTRTLRVGDRAPDAMFKFLLRPDGYVAHIAHNDLGSLEAALQATTGCSSK